MRLFPISLLIAVSLATSLAADVVARKFSSHPPVRPLPTASRRPLAGGPTFFVDGRRGRDDADGSRDQPWRTVARGLRNRQPGDTLVLRGGVYFEHVELSVAGQEDAPITVRSFPDELAVLDGGVPEFQTNPQDAWEPHGQEAHATGPGEFRSVREFPAFADPRQRRHEVALSGNFADSLVPLHGYRFIRDFRTTNEFWNLGDKLNSDRGLYCGPGVWFDDETRRVHVRLGHTHLKVLGQDNYRGETDPRRVPLIIAGPRSVLRIADAKHVRLQDLVIRGSSGYTVEVAKSEQIEFDHVTVYGGAPALHVRSTVGLKFEGGALRGLTAPWSSRASHKYRGLSPYLFIAAGDLPQCRDFELAHSEFTDNHDGLIIGTIAGLKFHHNLVENFDDDGLYLTMSRAAVPRDIFVYQNRLARTLTMFSFAESGKGVKNEVGPGVFICRNILDFRRRTYSQPPPSADSDASTTLADHSRLGRPASDHGSPVWEPMFVYHNTVISEGPAFRDYYGAGWGGHTAGTKRRLFNNIFVQVNGLPGLAFSGPEDDLIADGNLHWSHSAGAKFEGDFFRAFRSSKTFVGSQQRYAAGWTARDRFADPLFVAFVPEEEKAFDLRLRPQSPAVNAGVAIPADWFDPLRSSDAGEPDLGALPLGSVEFRVGPPE